MTATDIDTDTEVTRPALPGLYTQPTQPAPHTNPDLRLPEFLAMSLTERIDVIEAERAVAPARAYKPRHGRTLDQRIALAVGRWFGRAARPDRPSGAHRVRRGERFAAPGSADHPLRRSRRSGHSHRA